MNKFLSQILMSLLIFVGTACSDAKTDPIAKKTPNSSDANVNRASLSLTWAAQPGLTSFHVFYLDPNKKSLEIDSLQKTDAEFNRPTIVIDSSNMESWPSKGSKACFYVVADAAGLLSDASDSACLVL